jgi:nifR3 family TIM-barrel protein
MGSEPDQFARAAAAMVEAGYDVIDINFACPVKKVLGRCRGGFLLSQPDAAIEIIRQVHAVVAGRRPVTLKMRRGMDDSANSEQAFFRILDASFLIGIDAVTIHPRTVQQRYIGPSRWDFLRRVKKHVGNRTVLGSGDLFSADDVVRMMGQTGVDGVLLARGCIGNPWLFRECRAALSGRPVPPPPTVAEQREIIAEHYRLAVETYGELRGTKIMRKFGIKYAELHPMGPDVMKAFIAARSAADWHGVLNHWYDPAVNWPPSRRKTGPGHLIAAGAE